MGRLRMVLPSLFKENLSVGGRGFSGDKRENRTSEGPWWLWAPKAAEVEVVLERGQRPGVVLGQVKESYGDG